MNHDETHNDVTHNDAARDGASGSEPEDHAPTEGMEHRVAAAGAELLAQAARHSAAPVTVIRRAKARRRQRFVWVAAGIGILALSAGLGWPDRTRQQTSVIAIDGPDDTTAPTSATGLVTVTVPAGLRLDDLFRLLSESFPEHTPDDFRAVLDDGLVTSAYLPDPPPVLPAGFSPWEGLFFPSTYQFKASWTPQQVLQVLATEMDEKLDSFGYRDAESTLGYSPYQVLTMASIIHAESMNGAEAPKVAAVMYNRIEAGDFLGIDASTRFSQRKGPDEPLVAADFVDSDPFNTRRNVPDKIPPTPIGLPNEAALRAAINPAAGEWRWYVVDDDPNTDLHVFAETYEEFLAAKRRAELAGQL